ncbi:carboxymuconolactone decarboxylase family protein [Nonomuraea fuscirosea]|jgi:4-carboxymuconolactone decarboxylase|uniref:carboxymuconolactone decarboxylase family protein n=1 Tax=Nonomuraea fuscirosea TaxID=1291556 RepID=UPI002DDA7DA1|nr:carboxymuconolactone decarboxylase family protein [Nonomuraea fuscirosea]WSA57197.1 carboxymuconolactone decarboxylase family protein [Nonomuraea fuscirosea]
MSRIAPIGPDELDARQWRIYDALVNGRRASRPRPFPIVDEQGALTGPCNAWLLNSAIGSAFEQLGAAVRFEISLTAREREITILSVAQHRDSPYELYAHRLAGPAAGLSEQQVEALCAGEDPGFADERERVVLDTARLLLRTGALDDAAYQRAVETLGTPGLFEVTVIVGWYNHLATQLAVFDVRPPAETA